MVDKTKLQEASDSARQQAADQAQEQQPADQAQHDDGQHGNDADDGEAPIAQLQGLEGPVLVDPSTVTHVEQKSGSRHGHDTVTEIGTVGGTIITVLEDISTIAQLFGW